MTRKESNFSDTTNKAGYPMPRGELYRFIVNELDADPDDWAGASIEGYMLDHGDEREIHTTFGGAKTVLRQRQWTRYPWRPDLWVEYTLIVDGWQSDSESYLEPQGEKYYFCDHKWMAEFGRSEVCVRCGLVDKWGESESVQIGHGKLW